MSERELRYRKTGEIAKILWGRYPECTRELSKIPQFDLEADLLTKYENLRLSYLPEGSNAAVFRLDNFIPEPVTLKIITTLDDYLHISEEDESLWDSEKEEIQALVMMVKKSENFSTGYTLRQIYGHILASGLRPDAVDAPVAIWTVQKEGISVIAGYSLPFIEGEPTRIADDPLLSQIADDLEKASSAIYVGNRTQSPNGIIDLYGDRKLIDVEVR